MASIQGSINSMLGSASHAVSMVKSYRASMAKQPMAKQPPAGNTHPAAEPTPTRSTRVSVQQLAAQRAKQSAADAVAAKITQRRNFMEYLAQRPATIGDLSPEAQKDIAKRFSPSQRQRIMNAADKEKNNGKHR